MFGVGQDLLQHGDLLVDGVHVGGAGEVAAGGVVVGHQAGGGVVGDGGAHDGDVLGCRGHGLGGGGGYDKDEVVSVAYQLGGDGRAGGLVVLGILLVDLVLDARVVQGGHDAVVGGVEGGVLGELQHADLVGLVIAVGRRRTGRATAGAAASGEGEKAEGAAGDKGAPRDVVHDYLQVLGCRQKG